MFDLLRRKKIRFVGEQEGFIEEELKNHLYKYFVKNKAISKAFLVKISYDNLHENVALCLKAKSLEKQAVAEEISRIFYAVFNSEQFLDIIFIDKKQEKELAGVCKPFYQI